MKPMKTRVIFVCHGNICRSVMAEYIMKSLNNDLIIESRATSTEEIGNDIYPPVKRTLDIHDIKYDKHSASQITKSEYHLADYVIVMDSYNLFNLKRIIGDVDYSKIYKLNYFVETDDDIEDPWYSREFEKCFNEIYKACVSLNNKIK